MDPNYYKQLFTKKLVEYYDLATIHIRERYLHLKKKVCKLENYFYTIEKKKLFYRNKNLENYVKGITNTLVEKKFYIAANFNGVIGAFSTKEIANEMLLKYSKVAPIMFYMWKIDSKCTENDNMVWIITYKLMNVILYASNNKKKADKMLQEFLRINLISNDDIRYVGVKLNKISTINLPLQIA